MPQFYLTDKQGNKLARLDEEGGGLYATPFHDDQDMHGRLDHFLHYLNDRRQSDFWKDKPTDDFLAYFANSTLNHYGNVQVHGF